MYTFSKVPPHATAGVKNIWVTNFAKRKVYTVGITQPKHTLDKAPRTNTCRCTQTLLGAEIPLLRSIGCVPHAQIRVCWHRVQYQTHLVIFCRPGSWGITYLETYA